MSIQSVEHESFQKNTWNTQKSYNIWKKPGQCFLNFDSNPKCCMALPQILRLRESFLKLSDQKKKTNKQPNKKIELSFPSTKITQKTSVL